MIGIHRIYVNDNYLIYVVRKFFFLLFNRSFWDATELFLLYKIFLCVCNRIPTFQPKTLLNGFVEKAL